MNATFTQFLAIEKLNTGAKPLWRVTRDLVYTSAMLDAPLVVPEGFLTDFGSIPRPLRALVLTYGWGHEAAVLHDLLYTTHRFPRLIADCLLREALLAQGCPRALSQFLFVALRVSGAGTWKAPHVPQGIELPGLVEEATRANLREAEQSRVPAAR